MDLNHNSEVVYFSLLNFAGEDPVSNSRYVGLSPFMIIIRLLTKNEYKSWYLLSLWRHCSKAPPVPSCFPFRNGFLAVSSAVIACWGGAVGCRADGYKYLLSPRLKFL